MIEIELKFEVHHHPYTMHDFNDNASNIVVCWYTSMGTHTNATGRPIAIMMEFCARDMFQLINSELIVLYAVCASFA